MRSPIWPGSAVTWLHATPRAPATSWRAFGGQPEHYLRSRGWAPRSGSAGTPRSCFPSRGPSTCSSTRSSTMSCKSGECGADGVVPLHSSGPAERALGTSLIAQYRASCWTASGGGRISCKRHSRASSGICSRSAMIAPSCVLNADWHQRIQHRAWSVLSSAWPVACVAAGHRLDAFGAMRAGTGRWSRRAGAGLAQRRPRSRRGRAARSGARPLFVPGPGRPDPRSG
jgi:hypothetical protein